jgi:hypothetical protein
MANEMERGFYNAGLYYSLFGQFISLDIFNGVCVGSDFMDGEVVVGCF